MSHGDLIDNWIETGLLSDSELQDLRVLETHPQLRGRQRGIAIGSVRRNLIEEYRQRGILYIQCGTVSGPMMHARKGTPLCEPCKRAHRERGSTAARS